MALVISLAVMADFGGQLSIFENKTIDARYRYFAAPASHTDEILILDITEESLKTLEPVYDSWPWPRSVYAEAVKYLSDKGARAVGFDIIFSERDSRARMTAGQISEFVSYARNSDMPEVRSALVEKLESLDGDTGDEQFAEAAQRSGVVFQPAVFYADSDDLSANPRLASNPGRTDAIRSALARSAVPAFAPESAYFNATVPFAGLALASRGVGHINFTPDRDGVCRRFAPLLSFKSGKTAYPALSVLMAAHLKGVGPEDMRLWNRGLSVGDTVIRLLYDNTSYIPYQGGRVETDDRGKTVFRSFYRRIPFEYMLASMDFEAQGLEPALPGDTFRGKTVLITSSAVGLADLRATPFSPVTPGIEIHANIIDAILSGRTVTGFGGPATALYVLLLALCVAVISCCSGPFRGLLAVSSIVGLVTAVNWWMFGSGYVVPIVQPVFAMAGTYLGAVLLKYVNEFREKRFIRAAFGHYMAPAVLEEVLKSPDRLRLGGQKRSMTVLFSDIEGFSTFSEELSPEEIGSVLNRYLTAMVECVMKTNGSIDKFIGDAVMAFWNAPLEEKEHAALACEAALYMLAESRRLEASGAPGLRTRIGVNTGEMVVGNMGSRTIFDYTVLGSEVNTASRLEALNKDFGTSIAVSGSTREGAERMGPGKFVFRYMADVVLKGMRMPIKVHELVGLREQVEPKTFEALEAFRDGFDLFRSARFAEAEGHFRMVLSIMPDDGPSLAYMRQCESYIQSPPGQGWQAIHSQITK